jgi:hypothetical protein
MKWGGKVLVCILGVLFVGPGLKGMALESGETPFHGIVERNVFGLKPPTPAETPAPPPPPPVKITLTGITTILGNKRALLSAQLPNKPQEFYMLTEGQRDDDIEVVEINEAAGTVKVNNHGVPQTLDFMNNGAKGQPVAAAPLPPPMPGALPPPGTMPGTPQPAPIPPPRTIPTRTMRLSNQNPAPPGTPVQPETPPQGGQP